MRQRLSDRREHMMLLMDYEGRRRWRLRIGNGSVAIAKGPEENVNTNCDLKCDPPDPIAKSANGGDVLACVLLLDRGFGRPESKRVGKRTRVIVGVWVVVLENCFRLSCDLLFEPVFVV
jgi:hypothetical protein